MRKLAADGGASDGGGGGVEFGGGCDGIKGERSH